MHLDDQAEFEDPALRAAIRRTLGKQSAPADLRERLQQMLGTSVIAPAGQMSRGRSIMLGFSAAAIIVLSVAMVVIQVRNYVLGPYRPIPGMPDSLASSVSITHESCAKLADHHLIPGDDRAALASKLSDDLGFAVVIPDLGPQWKFKGAGECPVDDRRSAHLIFTNGDTSLSIFILPANVMSHCASSNYYESVVNSHPVTGVMSGGDVYCMIATNPSHSLSIDELRAISKRVRSSCSVPAAVILPVSN